MKTFYECENEHGTYYMDDAETIYQAYGNDPTFARFQNMLDNGEIEIVPYKGSSKEAEHLAKQKEREEAIERAWRDAELEKSDLELLKEIEKQFPELATKRQVLRDYPASKDFMKKRPI